VSDEIRVEVAFATPDRQELVEVTVSGVATVADAIASSGIGKRFPGIEIDALQTGIWGRPASRDQPLRDGDRVEIYRPLEQDPRDARRELAIDQKRGSSS